MLHQFVETHREEIIARCRAKVALRSVPPPTEVELLDHGVPLFLDQLVAALRSSGTLNHEITNSAILHGRDLLRQGFTVAQVVHDYGDVCQSVTDLAMELNAPISTDDFRTLNRCLDDAIAGAVTEFGRVRNQSGIDGEAARGSERLGFLAHELRNLTHTALLAFEALKTGSVGVAGNTGTVLHGASWPHAPWLSVHSARSVSRRVFSIGNGFSCPSSSNTLPTLQDWRQAPGASHSRSCLSWTAWRLKLTDKSWRR